MIDTATTEFVLRVTWKRSTPLSSAYHRVDCRHLLRTPGTGGRYATQYAATAADILKRQAGDQPAGVCRTCGTDEVASTEALITPFLGTTVSNGTLREEDLIPAFLDVLEAIDGDHATRLRQDAQDTLAHLEQGLNYGEAGDILSDLFDALNNACPEGYFFGSIEGDGACFGFWQYEEDAD